MVASPLLTTQPVRPPAGRRAPGLARVAALAWAALVLAVPAQATAEKSLSRVKSLDAREDGAQTVVTIHGSATPTFTVYKLEKPERVVIDVANARLDADLDGPVAVNTWAVGQVSAQALGERDATLVRVIVGFARPSTYKVQAVGNDLVVQVTAREPKPAGDAEAVKAAKAEAERAKAEAARAAAARDEAARARAEAEASKADADKALADANKARAEAERTRADVERSRAQGQAEIDRAKADANRAKAEADKVKADAAARQDELARRSTELERQAAEYEKRRAEIEKRTQDAEKARAEAEKQRAAAERERIEAEKQKAEAEKQRAEAEKQRREVDRRRADAEKKDAEAERKRAEAEKQRADAEAAAARAEERRRDAEKQAAEAVKRKAEADADRLAAKRAMREAEAQRAATEVERADLDKRRAELERRSAETERKARDAERRAREVEAAARAAREADAAAQATRKEAEQILADAQARRREAEEAAAKLEARRRAVESELARAEKSRREVEEALARAEKSRKDAEAAAADAARRAREAEASGAADAARKRTEAEAAAAQVEARRKEAEEALARAEKTRGEMEIALAKADRTRKDAEGAAAQAELRRREAEQAAQTADRERQTAETQRQTAETQRQAADRERQTAVAQRQAAEAQRSAAEAQRSAAEAEKAKAERDRQTAEAEKQKAEQARAAAEEARKREEAAAAKAEESRRASEAKRREAESALARVEESRAAAEAARIDAERRAKDARAAADKAAELARKQGATAQEIEKAKAAAERLATERRDAEAELAQRREALAADEARARKLNEARDRLAADVAAEERKLADAKRKRAAEEQKVAEAEKKAKAAPAPVAAKPAPVAAKPVPVAAKPVPVAARSTPVKVRDVDYIDKDDVARVVIELSGAAQPEVVAASKRQAILSIPAAEISPELERALDTREFEGPVTTISSFRDPRDPTRVRIVVDLVEKTDATLTRDGNRWHWDFAKPQAVVAAKVERTPTVQTRSTTYAPPVVGGYGAASTPVTAQTVAQSRKKVYRGSRVDIDLKEADIHNVLRFLADHGDVDIVVPDEIKGQVTLRLRRVPWDQALDVILKSKSLGYRAEGRIYRIAYQKDLDAEDQAERERRRARVQEERPETDVFTLDYADAKLMESQVKPLLSPKGKVQVDERTNSLVITDIEGNRAAIIKLLRRLDTQTPQVQIEARIVEARSTFLRELGVQWGMTSTVGGATGNPTGLIWPSTINIAGGADDPQSNQEGGLIPASLPGAADPRFAVNLPAAVGGGQGGALGFTFGSVGGNFNLVLRLSAAEDSGTVRIVSAPKIVVLNNMTAKIAQGVSIPISVVSAQGVQTTFIPADLSLEVTPHVSQRDCSIVLNTEVKKNEADFVNTGARGDPTLLRKEAKTTMLIADGETTVIGGIYTRNTGLSYSKVPYLAELPIIGYFFRSRRENDERTEVLIFLTPKITNKASLRCESPGRR